MTKKNKRPPLWVALVVDESGSMQSVRNATISGINEFLQDRRKETGDYSVRVWLTKFSTTRQAVFSGSPIQEIRELTREDYNPLGSTALLDAVGATIFSIESRLASAPEKPKVIVMIMTDGEENASKFFTNESIKKLIAEKEAEGNWTFTYMGAGQDSWANSRKMGIQAGNTVNYNNSTILRATKGVSNAVRGHALSDDLATTCFYSTTAGASITAEALADAVIDPDGTLRLSTTT